MTGKDAVAGMTTKRWISLAVATLLAALTLPFLLLPDDVICQSWPSLGAWFMHCHQGNQQQQQQQQQQTNSRYQTVEQFRITSLDSLRPSSIWCTDGLGGGPTNCRFESLCLNLTTHEYIFALDSDRSIFYPPKLRTTEEELELGQLSPVVDHNLFSFKHLVTVPYPALGQQQLVNNTVYLVPGHTLIASRFKPNNWMHLLHDDLLPLYATIHHQLGAIHLGHLFLDDHWTSVEHHHHNLSELILRALYGEEFPLARGHFPPTDSLVCFESAFIGLSSATAWYQYGFRRPQGPLERSPEERAYIRATTAAFRTSLLTAFHIDPICPTEEERPVLLLARAQNRRILNVQELLEHLQKRSKQFNGRNLRLLMLDRRRSLSPSSPAELASLLTAFTCADGVIAMHGSELALSLLLMSPGGSHTKKRRIFLLELFPYGVSPRQFSPFRRLASLLGHRYYAWSNTRREDAHFPQKLTSSLVPGLAQLSTEQLRQLHETVDQPLQQWQLLCCDQPAWLYRIYQDTRVDLESLAPILKDIEKEEEEEEGEGEGKDEGDEGQISLPTFRLSDVTDLRCSWSANGTTLHIAWKPPWNLPLLLFGNSSTTSTTTVRYEVLLQQRSPPPSSETSEEGLVIATTATSLTLPSTDLCRPQHGCHVWVKPAVDSNTTNLKYRAVGFFSQSPLLCVFNYQ